MLHFEWYVGGATKVDSTFLSWHLAPSSSSPQVGVALSADMEALFDTVSLTDRTSKGTAKALLQYYRNLRKRTARSGPRSLLDFFPVIWDCTYIFVYFVLFPSL